MPRHVTWRGRVVYERPKHYFTARDFERLAIRNARSAGGGRASLTWLARIVAFILGVIQVESGILTAFVEFIAQVIQQWAEGNTVNPGAEGYHQPLTFEQQQDLTAVLSLLQTPGAAYAAYYSYSHGGSTYA